MPDWPGPEGPERPSGYVVVTLDTTIRDAAGHDVGIAVQTLMLGAVERGLGGCMFGTVRKKELRSILGLPDNLEICLVVALGKPVEKVVLVDMEPDGSVKYYRDKDQVHYVPKRKRDDLIVKTFG